MPAMGGGGHDRILVFPMTGYMLLRVVFLGAGLIRVISGSLWAIPARSLCKMTQWGSPRMGEIELID
jgi:hypothetical protein